MSETIVYDESEGTPIFAIGRDFVPAPVDTVVVHEVGDEIVLIDEATGQIHALDRIGSVIWSCFDGSVDLGTIVDELAEAFGAPVEEVLENVRELTMTLARAELLQNIALPNAGNEPYSGTLEVGQSVAPFRLPTLDGGVVDLAELRGRQVLLVNWSPFCGFCVQIVQELGQLRPALEERGAELVLVASGEASANRELLEQNRVELRAAVREGAKSFTDPFLGMGTPVAYLLDEEGRVLEPLAQGSVAVPALVKKAAGIDKDASVDDVDGVKYLPAAPEGICGPGVAKPKKPRVWRPAVAYTAGEYRVGIRTETEQGDELIARMLAAHRVVGADSKVPGNYSVALAGNGSGPARDLNLLLMDNDTVVRSRSPRRVLLALVSYLSSHVGDSEDVLRTTALAAVSKGEAVLLPPPLEGEDVQKLQPKLARLGFQLVDAPYRGVDTTSGELVVREPDLDVDLSVLDELDEPTPTRTELPPVEPGRYPLRAWFTWTLNEDGNPSKGEILASAMPAIYTQEGHRAEAFEVLDDLFDRLPFFAIPSSRANDLAHEVQWHLAHTG